MSEPGQADLTLTIPVFNQLHYTSQCLESLNLAGIADSQIVIVNNASSDGTGEFLRQRPRLRTIHNPKNLGCGIAWTQGARASTSRWTVIANNDVLFAKNTLSRLIRFAEEHHVDIASPAMCEGEVDYDFSFHAANFMERMKGMARYNVVHGVCFAVHRRVFDKIGYFDQDPRLGGYEDDEYFRRARRAGFRLAITGSAFIHHFGSITQKGIKASSENKIKSLGDREYYRRKTGQTWILRKLSQTTNRLRIAWWRHFELKGHGYTLHKHRARGAWHYK